MLVNGARGEKEGRTVFGNVARVVHARRFAQLEFAGSIPLDEHVPRAATLRQPAAGLYPQSPAAMAYRALAARLAEWRSPDDESGGLEQFVQHLLHFCQHIDPVAIYA